MITKQEFATRLLFYLLPWPISKAFPKALRIHYLGPSGLPPAGWQYGWDPPDWWTNDPYNPNPGGPGPVYPPRPPGRGWLTYFDSTRWTPETTIQWTVDHWELTDKYYGELRVISNWWSGFRPDMLEVSFTGDLASIVIEDASANELAEIIGGASPVQTTFDWKIANDIYLLKIDFDTQYETITNIRFLET